MNLALVITVKNERRLLHHNLIYHHWLGVDHAYIFLDGTTDGTQYTLEHLPFVTVSDSVGVEKYQGLPYLQDFVSNHAEHHTARQMLNMVHAQQQAQQAGYDWLIALDADELLCVDPQAAYPDQLQDFFKAIPDQVELVRFKTIEVLQHRLAYDNVFAEETLFKSPGVKISRAVYDPYQQMTLTHPYYYGQTKGKSAVRTSLPAKPKTTHKFVSMGGKYLNTHWKGNLLHYYAYDFEDFIKKFENFKHHPNTYVAGSRVEEIKQLWRDLVNDPHMTPEELVAYYQRWVLFSPREVRRLKRKKILGFIPKAPGLITITAVKDFLNAT